MSFREDFEAVLREEQHIKEELNRLRREYKAAKERLATLESYAKEFDVNLDGDEPSTAGDDKPAKPSEPDGEEPSGTNRGAPSEPDNPGDVVVTTPSKPHPRGGVLLSLKPVPWPCCRAAATALYTVSRRYFARYVFYPVAAVGNRLRTDFLPSEQQR